MAGTIPESRESMGRLLRAAPLFALVAALTCCGRQARRVNVLIVSIDTLRADHLGCYGYAPYAQPVSPNLDALAREGLLFTDCSTARGQTAPSLGSLMTGLYPSHHGVIDNGYDFAPGTHSLAQELTAAGYEAFAFVSFVPGSRNGKATLGVAPDRAHLFEAKKAMRGAAFSELDQAAEQRFIEFVRARGSDSAQPFFAWVHFYDVHQPYTPPPPYDTLFDGSYDGPLKLPPELGTQEQREAWFSDRVAKAMGERMLARAPLSEADARYLVSLYDGGIRATDERVGRMLKALSQAGLADDTLVVVTADHGEELAQHNEFWFHGNSVHEPVLHIPLIVRGPGVRTGRCDALVQNVDVMPTLLERLGLPRPAVTDGVSLAPLLRSADAVSPRAIAWSEWRRVILGAQTRARHLIWNPLGASPKLPPYYGVATDGGYFVGCAELYDRARDPLEKVDEYAREKTQEEVAALRSDVQDEYSRRGFGSAKTPGGGAIDGMTPDELRRIGYVGEEDSGEESVVLDPARCREH